MYLTRTEQMRLYGLALAAAACLAATVALDTSYSEKVKTTDVELRESFAVGVSADGAAFMAESQVPWGIEALG